MKRTIRRGVFETNSSSTHSISIKYAKKEIMEARGADLVKHSLDIKGVLHLECGEFGWEEITYNDFRYKLAYLATSLAGGPGWEDKEQIAARIKKIYESNKNFALLKKVLTSFDGCEDVRFSRNEKDKHGSGYGYIDHQSCGTANKAFMNERNLRNYLFNNNSHVRTDNDNH